MDSNDVSRIEGEIQAMLQRSKTVNQMLDNEKRIYEAKKQEEVAELKRNMVNALHFLPAEMMEKPEQKMEKQVKRTLERKRVINVVKDPKIIRYLAGPSLENRVVESEEIKFREEAITTASGCSLSSVCFSKLSSVRSNSSQPVNDTSSAFRMSCHVDSEKMKVGERATFCRSYQMGNEQCWKELPLKIEAIKLANSSLNLVLMFQNKDGRCDMMLTMNLDENGKQTDVRMDGLPMKRT